MVCATVSYSQNQSFLRIDVNDMVYDDSRNKLFAVIEGTDSIYGNQLIQIDCITKQIEKSLYVGSNPGILKLTSDKNYLYVALMGSPKILKVDIVTFSILLQFPVGPIGSSVNIFAADIATIPESSNLIAVSRIKNNYVQDVVVFDNGVLLPDNVNGMLLRATDIECDDSGTELFGFNGETTGFDFGRMNISSTGVTFKDKYYGLMSGFNLRMLYADQLIYTSMGGVIDPHSTTPFVNGVFNGVANESKVALDLAEKESYFGIFLTFSRTLRVRRFDTDTFLPKGLKEFNVNFPPTMAYPIIEQLICYGTDKFIISTWDNSTMQENEKYIVFLDGVFSGSTTVPEEINKPDIIIYPNPVSERLKIDLTSFAAASKIEIINNNGQIVFSELLSGQTMVNVSVGSYNKGIYYVRIASDKDVIHKKIHIE